MSAWLGGAVGGLLIGLGLGAWIGGALKRAIAQVRRQRERVVNGRRRREAGAAVRGFRVDRPLPKWARPELDRWPR